MFRSMFGKKKRKSSGTPVPDDSIGSAVVGDVIVIPGFSPTFEDAYFIVESKNKLDSAYGKTFEIIAVDDDRKVSMEWSDDDDSSIAITDHDNPLGLSAIGVDEETLGRWDDIKSIENFVELEGEKYYYRNSHEVYYYKSEASEGEGFWIWDFGSEDDERGVSVVKWEGMPFEVYTSVSISSHVVRVYRQ
ncbi:MAG: hypothetical protein IIC24_02185 [Chloroflexi bacterium]|nr:hypothetical protein [Chloroflexota bacterium]MCH8310826.1 hypothetical protein [Chloroflexota bacterium]